ncbi:MAG: YitT family protein [Clostridia bacterium]|nr:YitT family protein [Clostridia bacterium]
MDKFKGIGKSKFARGLTYFLTINAGVFLLAMGIYFFKAPNGFATGGVSGISIILAKVLGFLPITQSMYMLAINTILLIIGVIILGKKCGALTFYCSLMMSVVNFLLEEFVPIHAIPGAVVRINGMLDGTHHHNANVPAIDIMNYLTGASEIPEGVTISAASLTGQPMLELIFAVLLTGIGSAILFRCNASSGGTDIVALILKKFTSMNVGTALLITDFLTASSTIFIFGVEVGLFSLLGLFAKVFVVDDILDSMNMCKSFTIITTKPRQIEDYITKEMKRGATVYHAEGAFSHQDKTVILTVCRRSEALRLRKKVKEIDNHSFMVITKTSEIMGKGFRDVE